MIKQIEIIIADDHPVFRYGLKQIIDSEKSFKIVAEAENGNTALELIEKLNPDLAILDIRMPGKTGLQVLDEIIERNLPTKVILLTMFKNANYFYSSISKGAKGYILKNDAMIDIVNAINLVYKGKQFVSKGISNIIYSDKRDSDEFKMIVAEINSLTHSEREVLKLISGWKTNKEIAEVLNISPRTAGNHRTNISIKLGINGSNGLIKFAIDNKDLL